MIRLSKSVVGIEEANAVKEVLVKDGYLGMGKYVQKFEQVISKFLNLKESEVICVNSGTAALHLAVQSIIDNEKNEILVPSLTYLSSFQAISAAGATPIACDVNEDSMIIDLDDAEARITKKTAGIMPVWYASNPYNYKSIYDFAKKFKIRVIEDAAHAFGCEINHSKIGSIGDIICFSFDGIKNITSGEGGAIITKDKKVINYCKDTRLLGVIKDTKKRFKGGRSWDFQVDNQGYRFHMSNIFAAIGIVQLKKLKKSFANKRLELKKLYIKELQNVNGIKLQECEEKSLIIPHIFPIRVLNDKRDYLKEVLKKNKVQTGIHYKPNHLLRKYKTNYNLLITEKLYKEIITLPLHPEMNSEDTRFICSIIKNNL
tara:strand:+ start:1251 stop:2369 length:1119 start_codon:yes stop_codon:yes gene_type:complete